MLFSLYEAAGKVVGKALYEGVLLHPVFSRAFLNKLLTKPCQFDDLSSIDSSMYKNL